MPVLMRGGGGGKKIKDATAVPGDVAQGKVFYNNDGRQVGNGKTLKTYEITIPKNTELTDRSLGFSSVNDLRVLQTGTTPLTYSNSLRNGQDSFIYSIHNGTAFTIRKHINFKVNIPFDDILSIEIKLPIKTFLIFGKYSYAKPTRHSVEVPNLGVSNFSYYARLYFNINNNVLTDIGLMTYYDYVDYSQTLLNAFNMNINYIS